MKLWLDDERPNPDGWVWTKTADEAIQILKGYGSVLDLSPDSPTRKLVVGYRFDERRRSVPVTWEEAKTITHMSFDHDLADVHYQYWHFAHNPAAADLPAEVIDLARKESAKEMTGYDVLLWMAEHNVWPTEACYVHTHNAARGKTMAGVINRYGPYDREVRWQPYQAGVWR